MNQEESIVFFRQAVRQFLDQLATLREAQRRYASLSLYDVYSAMQTANADFQNPFNQDIDPADLINAYFAVAQIDGFIRGETVAAGNYIQNLDKMIRR